MSTLLMGRRSAECAVILSVACIQADHMPFPPSLALYAANTAFPRVHDCDNEDPLQGVVQLGALQHMCGFMSCERRKHRGAHQLHGCLLASEEAKLLCGLADEHLKPVHSSCPCPPCFSQQLGL
jgi:hypothetical protein